MKTYIYILTDENDIPRYVGKSDNPQRRLLNHINESKIGKKKSHRTNWISSMLKKGLNPKVEIIDEINNDEWQFWECWWIDWFKGYGFDLVNSAHGGYGFTKGHLVSKETKDKISKKLKGKPSPHIGLKHSEESKKNMSLAQIGRKNPHNDEWNKKIGKSQIGKKISQEVKDKISKIVFQYSLDGYFIKEWNSAKHASIDLNISYTSILKVCRGERKSTSGFNWRFK